MILGPVNCGSFLDKVYLRLYENVLEISLKIVLREYEHFWPEVQDNSINHEIILLSTFMAV